MYISYTLADLKAGQTAIIESFTDDATCLKLLEMGCVPGETVKLDKVAPLGDPIAISVSGYMLSLRKSEAATIRIRINTK